MINSFYKKVAVAATLLGLTVIMMPDTAQAQRGRRVRFSGTAINQSDVNFEIDGTIPDGLSSNDVGYFPNAVLNFNIAGILNNSDICGQNSCLSGDLTVSRLTATSNGVVNNLRFDPDAGTVVTLNNLQNAFPTSGINFFGDVLRYDVSFLGGEVRNQPDLVWFIQSDDSNLINDLRELGNINRITGLFPRQANNGGTFTINQQNTSEPVPEPSTVAVSVLGIGGLGVRSLLQYRKRLKKTA